MIGPLTSNTAILSLLKKAGVKQASPASAATGTAKADPTGGLLGGLEKTDPARAAALKKQHQEALDLIKKLQGAGAGSAAERKTSAAEKVKSIKEHLSMLRAYSNVYPEAVVREASQAARELAQAVRDYTGAAVQPAGAKTKTGADTGFAADAGAAAGILKGIIDAANLRRQKMGAISGGYDILRAQTALQEVNMSLGNLSAASRLNITT